MRRWLALVLISSAFGSGRAVALDANPIDPELPLEIHATAYCLDAPDRTTGTDRALCASVTSDENPETLSVVQGNSDAVGDLRTATLHARGAGRAYWFGADQLRAGALATTTVYDTIIVGGSYTGPLEVQYTAAGSFVTTDANPNVMGSEANGLLMGMDDQRFLVGSTGVRVYQYNSGEVYLYSQDETGSASLTTNAAPSGEFDPADVRFTLSVVFPVTTEEREFAFLARFNAGGALGFTASEDVLKESIVDGTAQLAVILPEGVPWTSGSGVLLAPAPGASASALTALGALLALRRAGSARTPSPRSTRRACAARRARSRVPCPARGT